jgi:hypothetical protein
MPRNAIAARIAMMNSATSTSTSVKPRARRRGLVHAPQRRRMLPAGITSTSAPTTVEIVSSSRPCRR